jgi:hypothetical protein
MNDENQHELEEAIEIVALYLLMFPEHPLTDKQTNQLKEAMHIIKKHNVSRIENSGQWQII